MIEKEVCAVAPEPVSTSDQEILINQLMNEVQAQAKEIAELKRIIETLDANVTTDPDVSYEEEDDVGEDVGEEEEKEESLDL